MFRIMVPPAKLSWIFTDGSKDTCGFGDKLFNPIVASLSVCTLSSTGIGITILELLSR